MTKERERVGAAVQRHWTEGTPGTQGRPAPAPRGGWLGTLGEEGRAEVVPNRTEITGETLTALQEISAL